MSAASVATDGKGFIPVNSRLETTTPGILATSNVCGTPDVVVFEDWRIAAVKVMESRNRMI